MFAQVQSRSRTLNAAPRQCHNTRRQCSRLRRPISSACHTRCQSFLLSYISGAFLSYSRLKFILAFRMRGSPNSDKFSMLFLSLSAVDCLEERVSRAREKLRTNRPLFTPRRFLKARLRASRRLFVSPAFKANTSLTDALKQQCEFTVESWKRG